MAALGGGLRAVARGGLPAARLLGNGSRALCTGGADDGAPSGLSAEELQRRLDLLTRVSAAEPEGGSGDAERAAQRSAERRAARRAALIAYLSAAKLPAKLGAGAEPPRPRVEAEASETSLNDDMLRAHVDDMFEHQSSSDVHAEYTRKALMQKKLWWLVCTQALVIGNPMQRRVSKKTQRARDARDERLTLSLKFAALRKWREAESKAGARRPETDRSVAAPPKPRALGRDVDAGGEDQGRQ